MHKIIQMFQSVWPDWPIFESCCQQHFLQKNPKWLATFGAILKNLTLVLQLHWLLFGGLLENLGYFLVKHLVTLVSIVTYSHWQYQIKVLVMKFSAFFKKKGHSRPPFLYFHLFYKQLTVNKCSNKSCQWLDLNPGPLVL